MNGLRAQPGWGPVLVSLVGLLACVLLLYRDTATAMVAIWSRSDTFAHAFSVPPIVAWLVWRQRHALAAQMPKASGWVLLPIAAAGLLWLLGDLAAVNAATQLGFTALLVLVVIAVLGPRAARSIAFPLGFLFFAVPIGEFVMPQMMEWTADFTVFALRLSGIPVFREGLQFVIPSGNWSVVEACSGIRYLIASVMVGVLFAYLNYRSLRRRLIFVGIAVLVPVVANWVRAYLIVLTGHLSGNTLAVGVDHLIYGWVFFGVVITLMFMIGARWSEPPEIASDAVAGSAATTTGANAAQPGRDRLLWAVAAGAAALVIVPHLALRAVESSEHAGAPQLAIPSALGGGWQAGDQRLSSWKPAFKGAAAEVDRVYVSGAGNAGAVGLHIAYYRQQDYARKLVSSDNVLVSSSDSAWSQVGSGSRQIRLGDSGVTTLRTAQLRGSGHAAQAATARLVVWQLYWINGTLTASDSWAKVCTAFYRLLGRGDDAAVIIVSANDAVAGGADAALEGFLRANLHVLSDLLADTRASRQPADADNSGTLSKAR